MPYRFDGVDYNGLDFTNGGVSASASIIKNQWKLIYFFENKVFELYNLNDDIGEKHNLISNEPSKAKELITELDKNMREKHVEDVLPLRLPNRKPIAWPLEI